MTDLRALHHALSTGETGRPVITCYDRMPGPTEGERIEISARVMLTWAAKAAGALTDELLVEPGTRVGLALPPHWRAGYWALAAWWAGATLVTGEGAAHADVLVTDDVDLARAHSGEGVLVSLPALVRRHPGPVPAGFLDEAAELASFPDRYSPAGVTSPAATAWSGPDTAWRYDTPITVSEERAALVAPPSGVQLALQRMVELWAGGGSLVLVRADGTPSDLAQLLGSERVSRVETGW